MFLLNVCVAVFPSLILLGVLAILEPGEGASPFNTFNFLQLWNIFHAGHNTSALLDEGIVSFPKIAFQLIFLNNRKLKGHIIMFNYYPSVNIKDKNG